MNLMKKDFDLGLIDSYTFLGMPNSGVGVG